jgi:hypothetical protein
LEIPIIESFHGETPMDIALAVEGKSQLSSLFSTKVEIENRPQDIFGKEFEESIAQEFLNQK